MLQTMIIKQEKGKRMPNSGELRQAGFIVSSAVQWTGQAEEGKQDEAVEKNQTKTGSSK